MSAYRGLVPLSVGLAEFEAFGERVERRLLNEHLAERERAETLYACTGCGHDSRTHEPHNMPPYACGVDGCQCSRTPDALIVEAPDTDDAPLESERKAS